MEKQVSLRTFQGFDNYEDLYKYSVDPETREKFWANMADTVDWIKKPTKILDDTKAPYFYKWYDDGTLNICYNCVDRWAEKTPDSPALIYEGRICGKKETWSYKRLKEEVELYAGILVNFGLKKGDTAIIYMPMINLSLTAMLACARQGITHSVVFGGFAPKELAGRIEDTQCKIILSAACGIEPHKMIDYPKAVREALSLIGKSDMPVLYVDRPQLPVKFEDNEFDFETERKKAKPQGCVEVESSHPLYILYTSGSTGQPKGVQRDTGGTAVAVGFSVDLVFDLQPGDVFFATSDIGWVVGHTYNTYGPLQRGAATIIYEGKPNTGNPGVFWDIVQQYKVKSFYTSPTAMRFLRKEDPEGKYFKDYDVSCMKHFGIVGERTDVHTYHWIKGIIPEDCTYNDTWWQTETGHIISSNLTKPERHLCKPGSCTKSLPGFDVRVFSEEGKEVENGTHGYVVLKQPVPPSFMSTLWRNDEAFIEKYMAAYKGYYLTGDAGYYDTDGHLHIMSRIDDVINTAGHRLSTAQIEETLLSHDALAEAAVVAAYDNLKGEIPVAQICFKSNFDGDHKEVQNQLIQIVRRDIGPLACFTTSIIVDTLPKTRSGKILRGCIKKMLNGLEYGIPATIQDESVLPKIMLIMIEYGYGKKKQIEFEEHKLDIDESKHDQKQERTGSKDWPVTKKVQL